MRLLPCSAWEKVAEGLSSFCKTAEMRASLNSIAAAARILHTPAGPTPTIWQVPEEVPIAILFNSEPYAVMMATPADLDDFAIGFALAEGIIASADSVKGVLTLPSEEGLAVDLAVDEAHLNRAAHGEAQPGRPRGLRALRH